jgi:hypothetical protein
MYNSYVEIEYIATSFSPARTDLAVKLLRHGASALTSCAAMGDFRDAILSTQPKVGVLLLNTAT